MLAFTTLVQRLLIAATTAEAQSHSAMEPTLGLFFPAHRCPVPRPEAVYSSIHLSVLTKQ